MCEIFCQTRQRKPEQSVSQFMKAALEEAQAAALRGEVPVGAVVVHGREIISRAGNETLARNDPTAHAEMLAIRMACEAMNSQRLGDCDLYVTLEPCPMCAGAISFARVKRLYFGAEDTKGGAVENGVRFFGDPTCHHAPEVYSGLAQKECAEVLRQFFREKRG